MNYHNITKTDMLNGEGIRVVLWVSGCSHACKGCQNPQTWSECGGIKFDESAKQEIFEELDKDYISGITFSGGDPLFVKNRDCVTALAKEIRQKYGHTKTIWSYTGYLYEEVKDLEIMEYLDVLIDGPFILEQRDPQLHWVGSPNQRIIDVQKTRETGEIVLYKGQWEDIIKRAK